MRIDSHAGFCDRGRFHYAWMPPAPSPMNREFAPTDLERILVRNKFEGAVAVAMLEDPAETDWLLEEGERHTGILGVLGWLDWSAGDAAQLLSRWRQRRKFRGLVRTAIQADLLGELARLRLVCDCAAAHQQFPELARLARQAPEATIVVDHLGRPDYRAGDFAAWRDHVDTLAGLPNVFLKVSRLINDAAAGWNAAWYRPYVQHALAVFGPDHLMYGSDWPHCMWAGTWKESLAAFTQALGAQSIEVRAKLLGETARRVYGLTAL